MTTVSEGWEPTPYQSALQVALYSALPADNIAQVKERMSKHKALRDYELPKNVAMMAINHVRQCRYYYGWTVQPVKRGSPKPNERARWTSLLQNTEGEFFDERGRDNFLAGTNSTTATGAEMMARLATAFEFAQKHERSATRRAHYAEAQDIVGFAARRLANVVKLIRAA